jgi:hypothetical protein
MKIDETLEMAYPQKLARDWPARPLSGAGDQRRASAPNNRLG